MIKVTCIILFYFGFASALPNHRIIGGEEVVKGEAQFQAQISYNGQHLCGGAILAREWIVTAAQCMEFPSSGYSVTVGEHSLSSIDGDEQEAGVSRIVIHPDWDSASFANDIALVKLDRRLLMDGETVSPALPPTQGHTPPSGTNAVAYGWGETVEGEGVMSDILRKVAVGTVSDDECRTAYGGQIADSMLCAGEAGKDSCAGDAGGPLICNDADLPYICGIVSWGSGCGRPGFPGVYTEVSHFMDWIEATINEMPAECQYIPIEPLTPEGYVPLGEIVDIGGLEVYEAPDKSHEGLIILIQDRFDFFESTHLRQHADRLNAYGFQVVIPKLIVFNETMNRAIHNAEAAVQKKAEGLQDLPTWEGSVRESISHVLEHYKALGVSKFGTFSFCWGGTPAVFASNEFSEDILVTTLVHPWLFYEGKHENLLMGPAVLLPGNNDPPMDDFCNVIKQRLGMDVCVHQRFDDVIHGFAGATGDWTNEVEKNRAEEVLQILKTQFCRYVR